MRLADIKNVVAAKVICCESLLNIDIQVVCCADLMSDVLACNIKPNTLLITSLANTQVMRTAEMVELAAIIFIRGKKPNQQMIKMAEEVEIPLLSTDDTMFNTCGKLYELKLMGCW